MTSLHIASLDDLELLLPMLDAALGAPADTGAAEARIAALVPLLDGAPHGVVYLIGPRRSPVGFIAVSFGWSLAAGGLVGRIDVFWIRPAVRGRGMGADVLLSLVPALSEHGLRRMRLELPPAMARAETVFRRAGFQRAAEHLHLERRLS